MRWITGFVLAVVLFAGASQALACGAGGNGSGSQDTVEEDSES